MDCISLIFLLLFLLKKKKEEDDMSQYISLAVVSVHQCHVMNSVFPLPLYWREGMVRVRKGVIYRGVEGKIGKLCIG